MAIRKKDNYPYAKYCDYCLLISFYYFIKKISFIKSFAQTEFDVMHCTTKNSSVFVFLIYGVFEGTMYKYLKITSQVN